MRSAPAAGTGDLTARARIRDAAVEVFGSTGFDAPVRAVAARAGVSPGLLNHHFGSKDGLRAACDEHVLRRIREAKTDAVTGSPAAALARLAAVEEHAPLAAYVLQALQAGGDLAAAFVEQMVSDAEGYLAAGVAAGTVRPSRDPAARARHLTLSALGSLLLHARLRAGGTDLPGLLRHVADSATLPALEIYTEGLFTDRSMLDDYLMQVPDPPGPPADPVPTPVQESP
ncbi:TetR/AcrR family transcriptional regulator [Pseudonocardia abyssalis]|uniref:TetR family transcriptional regulator n=2 Tax=Pseudonocardia abyssalis TaxID=2792008 RepID=A0ABS6UKA2_9PSEU|nr:TetR family transcriptional regulator [Pseudonocardia abyssalis]MBW0132695.1 TetR family transcriptional regulator [Pseudonocardia abyssalis]